MTMAAMWSGIGDVKKAMLGKRISWLWIAMTLCDVMMAEKESLIKSWNH